MYINDEDKFFWSFLQDNCLVAIPLLNYAIKFDNNSKFREDLFFHQIKDFVKDKAVESGEPLVLVVICGHRHLYGTVLSHRIFYDWLLTQTME